MNRSAGLAGIVATLLVVVAVLTILVHLGIIELRVARLHFETHGGNEIAAIEVRSGDLLPLPENPKKEDYVFGGWFLDPALSEPLSFAFMPRKDIVLYARWFDAGEQTFDFLRETPNHILINHYAFVNYIDYVLFYRIDEATVVFVYPVEELEDEINRAFQARHIQANVQLNFTYNANKQTLQITAEFSDEALHHASENPLYTTRPFYRTLFESARGEDFEAFKVYDIVKTSEVTTSDQLYYVMEMGYRPVFEETDTVAEAMYNAAKSVLRNIVDDTMTDTEKLLAITHWLVANVTYDGALLAMIEADESNLTHYRGFFLEGVFEDGMAVCDGYSKAMLVMARLEGIVTVRVVGESALPDSTLLHAWNKVLLDDVWYVVDATSANLLYNDTELMTHGFFLIDDETYSNHYVAHSYLDIEATGNLKVYEMLTFTYSETEYNRTIESPEELSAVLSYYKSLEQPLYSFDVLIAFDYEDDFNAYLSHAMFESGVDELDGVLLKNNVFIFWQAPLD